MKATILFLLISLSAFGQRDTILFPKMWRVGYWYEVGPDSLTHVHRWPQCYDWCDAENIAISDTGNFMNQFRKLIKVTTEDQSYNPFNSAVKYELQPFGNYQVDLKHPADLKLFVNKKLDNHLDYSGHRKVMLNGDSLLLPGNWLQPVTNFIDSDTKPDSSVYLSAVPLLKSAPLPPVNDPFGNWASGWELRGRISPSEVLNYITAVGALIFFLIAFPLSIPAWVKMFTEVWKIVKV